jgi:hypothetical protein
MSSSSSAKPEDYGPRAGIIAPLPMGERGIAMVTSASPDGKLLIYCNGTNVVVRSMDVSLPYILLILGLFG